MRLFAITLALLLFLPGLVTATAIDLSPRPGQFYIYLVNEPNDYNNISNKDIKKLELGSIPLLTINDIISYNVKNHELKITESAYNRIFQHTGENFVVCVGKDRIYAGIIWNGISAVYPPSDVFLPIVPPDFEKSSEIVKKNIIRIQFGFSTEEDFKGQDTRSDPRIINALKRAEKLKE